MSRLASAKESEATGANADTGAAPASVSFIGASGAGGAAQGSSAERRSARAAAWRPCAQAARIVRVTAALALSVCRACLFPRPWQQQGRRSVQVGGLQEQSCAACVFS